MVIDVFSDVVCPWCYIGTERLRQVLDAEGLRDAVTVNFHPFFLDPTTPEEGRNLAKTLREKYGRDPRSMYGAVEDAGRDVGITFKFSEDQMGYPSVRAHMLLAYARDHEGEVNPANETRTPVPLGVVDGVKRDLFTSYFERHENINDVDVLVDIAAKNGFNAEDVRGYLDTAKARTEVFAHAEEARRLGIQGVPFFVFGGGVYISGAQPATVFARALHKMLDDSGAMPAN